MERILTDIAGLLRGQALALRNVGDLLDAQGYTTLSEKAVAAHRLVLEAARELEEEVIEGAQNRSVQQAQRGAEDGHESRR